MRERARHAMGKSTTPAEGGQEVRISLGMERWSSSSRRNEGSEVATVKTQTCNDDEEEVEEEDKL